MGPPLKRHPGEAPGKLLGCPWARFLCASPLLFLAPQGRSPCDLVPTRPGHQLQVTRHPAWQSPGRLSHLQPGADTHGHGAQGTDRPEPTSGGRTVWGGSYPNPSEPCPLLPLPLSVEETVRRHPARKLQLQVQLMSRQLGRKPPLGGTGPNPIDSNSEAFLFNPHTHPACCDPLTEEAGTGAVPYPKTLAPLPRQEDPVPPDPLQSEGLSTTLPSPYSSAPINRQYACGSATPYFVPWLDNSGDSFTPGDGHNPRGQVRGPGRDRHHPCHMRDELDKRTSQGEQRGPLLRQEAAQAAEASKAERGGPSASKHQADSYSSLKTQLSNCLPGNTRPTCCNHRCQWLTLLNSGPDMCCWTLLPSQSPPRWSTDEY